MAIRVVMHNRSSTAIEMNTQTKCYIVTDLDNTLVGNTIATQEFNQKILNCGDRVGLIYATGRSYESAKQLQTTETLLEPQYWITGVGSEIYQNGILDSSWSEHLKAQWHREKIHALALEFPELLPQPNSSQNEFKISFYLHDNNAKEILSQLRDRIATAGFAAQVIYSSNEDLDILPIRCDKGLALRHLMTALKINNANTIVCGDSGNDIGLFKQDTLGIIVNNAQIELLNWYKDRGGDMIYYANNDHAAGILEGLDRLKPGFFTLD
jgi:sucrose-6-phosphatase